MHAGVFQRKLLLLKVEGDDSIRKNIKWQIHHSS